MEVGLQVEVSAASSLELRVEVEGFFGEVLTF